MGSNPYAQALHDSIGYYFCKDQVNTGTPTELLCSLLSTEVIYALHTTNTSPYSPIYSERLYDCLDLSEINNPRVLNGNCSDRFEEFQSTLKISAHFEETSDVSTTYMGKLCPTGRNFDFENQIFVTGRCTSQGALMDKTPMRVLFDMGARKSYMSECFYIANTGLHTLPKLSITSKGLCLVYHPCHMLHSGPCVQNIYHGG